MAISDLPSRDWSRTEATQVVAHPSNCVASRRLQEEYRYLPSTCWADSNTGMRGMLPNGPRGVLHVTRGTRLNEVLLVGKGQEIFGTDSLIHPNYPHIHPVT